MVRVAKHGLRGGFRDGLEACSRADLASEVGVGLTRRLGKEPAAHLTAMV